MSTILIEEKVIWESHSLAKPGLFGKYYATLRVSPAVGTQLANGIRREIADARARGAIHRNCQPKLAGLKVSLAELETAGGVVNANSKRRPTVYDKSGEELKLEEVKKILPGAVGRVSVTPAIYFYDNEVGVHLELGELQYLEESSETDVHKRVCPFPTVSVAAETEDFLN